MLTTVDVLIAFFQLEVRSALCLTNYDYYWQHGRAEDKRQESRSLELSTTIATSP